MRKFSKVIALVLCFTMIAMFASCKDTKQPNETTTSKTDNTTKAAEGNEKYDLSKEGKYTAENTEYFIGATGPLTGDVASYGVSVQRGAQIAVEEINASNGLNGVKFHFEILDDKCVAADATNGYNTLFERGMQVSLGSVTTAPCKAFASEAKEDGLFFITPSASAQSIIDSSRYAFRVCFGDPDQGVLAAQKLAAEYKKIGAIYDSSDPYSSGIFEAFEAEMKKLGKEFIPQSFDQENNRDFSTQIEALKECEVIFLPIYYTEAGLIAKACVAKGCKALLFGCDGLDGVKGQIDDSVLQNNKIKYITPFNAESDDPRSVDFVKKYKEKYNTSDPPDQFAADGYDAIYIIFKAMEKTGVNNVKVAPEELGNALVEAITDKSFSYKGLTGDMHWEPSGNCVKNPDIVELN